MKFVKPIDLSRIFVSSVNLHLEELDVLVETNISNAARNSIAVMASTMFKRISMRQMPIPFSTASRSSVSLRMFAFQTPISFLDLLIDHPGPSFTPFSRSYASEAEPGRSSSIGTPSPKPSDSPQEGDIKSNRATDSASSPDTASTQKPVSPAGAQGQDEEGQDPAKQDPSKPAGQKASEVEQQGQKPLDPADK